MKTFQRIFAAVAAAAAVAAVPTAARADANMPVPGSAGTGVTGFATDAFPGFDPDSWNVEQKKPSFWFSVKRQTPAEQFEYARTLARDGKYNAARKAYEALVREWPETFEAALSQEAIGSLWVTQLDDIYEAFEEYDYLLRFYPGLCKYADVVSIQYKIAEMMYEEQKSKGFFSFTWTSQRSIRRKFERVIRYAPGAPHVPAAMMRVGELRREYGELEEAALAYEGLCNRFPGTEAAEKAAFLRVEILMELVRKHPSNRARKVAAVNAFRRVVETYPANPRAAEVRSWIEECEKAVEEAAWNDTVFYDTRQRKPGAAIAAYERYIEQYPGSERAAAARARIEAIKGGAAPLRK